MGGIVKDEYINNMRSDALGFLLTAIWVSFCQIELASQERMQLIFGQVGGNSKLKAPKYARAVRKLTNVF